MLKKIFYALVCLGLITSSNPGFAQIRSSAAKKITPRQAIMEYAKRGDFQKLQQLKSKGYSIDLSDANGNTSLCEATWEGNKNAVATLIKAGASTNSNCMHKIPQNYKQAVGLKNVGTTVAQTSTTATGATSSTAGATSVATATGTGVATATTATSTGTFLGMGAVGWGVTGAVVAGGAVAAVAAGGGGGGSSKSAPVVCSGHGTQDENGDCICNTGYTGDNCESCATNYGLYGTTECHAKLNCVNGSQSGAICSCDTGYTGTLCDTENACTGYNYTTCPTGYAQSATCQSGTTTKLKCDNCAEGYEKNSSGNCQLKQSEQNKDVVGLLFDVNTVMSKDDLNANNSNISLTGVANQNVYGIKTSNTSVNIHNALSDVSDHAIGRINITNSGSGNAYGMYGTPYNLLISNTYAYDKGVAEGYIFITNNGTGNAIGIFGGNSSANAFSASINQTEEIKGSIRIKNASSGNIYGIASDSAANLEVYRDYIYSATDDELVGAKVYSEIIMLNEGDGKAYGLFSSASSHNLSFINIGQNSLSKHALINITNKGNNSVYGMYGGGGYLYSSSSSAKPETYKSEIILINENNGNAYGMFSHKDSNNNSYNPSVYNYSGDTIELVNQSNGTAVGIYVKGLVDGYSTISNSGNIKIHNLGTGTAVGIYAAGKVTVENSGQIIIDRNDYTNEDTFDGMPVTYTKTSNVGGLAIGIYGDEKSNIRNLASGQIIINGAETAYGIYKETDGAVQNFGSIIINGNSSHPNAIKLNGSSLFQSGLLQAYSLNLNDFGGNVIATTTSQFNVTDTFAGDLNISADTVTNGFDKVYTVSDMIQAADTTGLNLISQSALFDASLVDGKDVVMTMKSFDSVTDNKSLATFLEKNYTLGNNEAFFNEIKSVGNASAFKSTMDSLTGQNTIAKFTHEDLTTMREVNFTMNEQMFANDDKQVFEKQGSVNGFSFKNDNHSAANYALGTKRIAPRWKVGYAMSNTTINTDDDHDTTRHNQIFQVFAPIGYENSGIKLISTPQIGFARGHYTRKGYNDTSYNGTIEKRIFALMNEARYPVQLGGFEFAPTVEFNTIAYNQKGSEGKKEYALTMPSDNQLSVEAGMGLYANKQIGNVKLNAGLMMYREFADPYNVKMGMNGMEGTFNLYDDNREYRGVASFGFNYDLNAWNVYGKVQHFMESDNHTNVKTGVKYSF